jgi:glycosyltransferase involved in cell wall biosynthesis
MGLNTGILERLRSNRKSADELGRAARIEFRRARHHADYRSVYEKPQPLVSICIATYNRAQLLLERSLASSLAQTYPNIEVIVIGDCCTDETAELMAQITDPRVRFLNRCPRGDYPAEPELRWMVAGADAMNHAFALARGDLVTHLDDDDLYAPDRVEKLVSFMKRTRADLVFHPFEWEQPDGSWQLNEAKRFQLGSVTNSSIIYHRWFLRHPYDKVSIIGCREPGDWNRLRKLRYLGARIARHPDATLRHFRERSQYGR